MARQPSNSDKGQLILGFDVLYMILMDYLEKDKDVLNFMLASKLYYEQFHNAWLLHNVLHRGCTALEGAGRGANRVMVERILEIPGIEAAVPRGMWPMTVAIARACGCLDIMRLILKVNCVRTSIDEEAHEIAIKGTEAWKGREFGDSWLQIMWDAVRSDQADVVDLFLSHGMTVELCGPSGMTALHIATGGAEKEHLVRLLLEKYKADPNNMAVTSFPWWDTPLHLAAARGSATVVKLLLEHKADPCYGHEGGLCPALGTAAERGHKDVVEILSQDERVELSAQDWMGVTVLSDAVWGGKADVVQMLLENERIDPNAPASHGRSPLLIAAQYAALNPDEDPDEDKETDASGLAMTKLLLSDKRVDMFLRDDGGRNALFWAARSGKHKVLEMYLADGRLDPNETDNDLRTPVSATSCEKCMDLLINDTRVDLNMADNRGMTPLMHNTLERNKANIERLISSCRVDVGKVNMEGNTALRLALRTRGCNRIVTLLRMGKPRAPLAGRRHWRLMEPGEDVD
ncbi:uncharacterized protein TrAFT101_000658 [Trichoderma asperellum]|uniref:uncharacterized protein n=1 Tax=Trichoderma asperellum TaxID=101201 RepID=UPI0033300AC6|nr:hypothetical protein TrAFT101_000658 [Trichoderma asperellum]